MPLNEPSPSSEADRAALEEALAAAQAEAARLASELAQANDRETRSGATAAALERETARRKAAEAERDTLLTAIEELRTDLAARSLRLERLETRSGRFVEELAILARKVDEANLRADNITRECDARLRNALKPGAAKAPARGPAKLPRDISPEPATATAPSRFPNPVRALARALKK